MTETSLTGRYRSDTNANPVALSPLEEPLKALQEAEHDREEAKEEAARVEGKIERAEDLLDERKAQHQDAADVDVALSGVEEDIEALESTLEDHRNALREARERQEEAARRMEEARATLTERVRSGFQDVREEVIAHLEKLFDLLIEIRYFNALATQSSAAVPVVRGWRDRLNDIVQDLNDDGKSSVEVPRELPEGARATRNQFKS